MWAVDPSGSVMRVDRASNRIVRRLDVPIDRTVHTNAVYGGDSLWVSSDSTMLFRVNPASGAIERIDVGGGVPFVAHDGLIWVGIRRPGRIGTVLRLDQQTGAVVAETTEVDIPARIEFGFEAVWITDSGSSTVYRISPVLPSGG